MGWVVNSTPRPLYFRGKTRWAPGLVCTGAENLAPTGIRSRTVQPIIIIIIIIFITIIISFMQSIYTYIPETNYVPREYSVAVILLLLFMVLISLVPVLNLLYFYIAIHIAPYHFSYFLFCPSPSLFHLCMFHCILGLMALTVSERSALSCLVAVTFLNLWSTRFPATPDVSIPGFQVVIIIIIIIIILPAAASCKVVRLPCWYHTLTVLKST